MIPTTHWITRDDHVVKLGDKVLCDGQTAKIAGISLQGHPIVELLTGPAAGSRLQVHPTGLIGRCPSSSHGDAAPS